MKKNILYTCTLFLLASSLLVSCKIDNYEAPNAHLYGKLIDSQTNQPVPCQRLWGPILSLIQIDYGSGVANPINSVFHADGSYDNATIFSGKYKVVPVGPFIYTDTLIVDVKGSTLLDIKVKPDMYATVTPGTPTATSISFTYKIKSNTTQQIVQLGAAINETLGIDVQQVLNNDNAAYRIILDTSGTPNATIDATTYSATFNGLNPNTEYFVRAFGTIEGSLYWNHSDIIKIKTLN
jgi:hypothetical protein